MESVFPLPDIPANKNFLSAMCRGQKRFANQRGGPSRLPGVFAECLLVFVSELVIDTPLFASSLRLFVPHRGQQGSEILVYEAKVYEAK